MNTAASPVRLRFLVIGFGVAILALASFLFFSGEKSPEELGFRSLNTNKTMALTRTQDFQDWRLECRGEPERCYVAQGHVRQDNQQQALKVIVSMGKDKNGAAVPLVRIIAPLGIHLASGLAISVDEGKQVKMPFGFCGPVGCRAEFGAGGQFLNDVRGGSVLHASYKEANGKPVTINVSLKGFTDALAALPAAQ